ncbi:lactonase family protein [Chitinophaga sp. GCM10012297]|uniref:Lactonase family protein n=1 Tax=Chitinophaga chungangae TaxID=2821488 RepID=A0ABS3Y8F1_9BACT|nr:lactonase family protein [Chitinophaga chungangae]MBO9150963.1 lactonase family protein [Chitinophaga chungangae]
MQKNQFLIVGTYTNAGSKGIYVFRKDAVTGRFIPTDTAGGVPNPSFLTLSPDKQFLYAVSEFSKDSTGSAFSYAFDRNAGTLQLINHQLTGAGPCHISTDAANRFVFTGNYNGGSLTVLPVQADGSLAAAVQQIVHQGSGPVASRQKTPHVHSANFSPDGKQLLVPDLGTDKVMIYDFEPSRKMRPLQPAAQPFASVEPGGGPRHLVFHPNGRYAYLVLEISGKTAAFSYANGHLALLQTISGAPADYKGSSFGSADIHVSPDGKFLYMSSRGDLSNLSIYRISEKDGTLFLIGHQPTLGKEPRNFLITPDGQYLLAANQKSNTIVVFKRDLNTGLLTATGEELAVPTPVCLKWVE